MCDSSCDNENGISEIIHKFVNSVSLNETKHLICHCNLVNSKEEANWPVSLRESIEENAEIFYFDNKIDEYSLDTYVRNLVSINPTLVIDDIISHHLIELRSFKNIENILRWIYNLLLNRGFNRSILKDIFNVILYLDFENDNQMNFYKYKILTMIIVYYKIGDVKIEKSILRPTQEIKDIISAVSPIKLKTVIIGDETDMSNDNVFVMSNLIWENTLYLLEMFSFEKIDDFLIDKDKIIETADSEYYEALLIIELYTEILLHTGVFFQNRILKNINVFSKFVKIINFDKFVLAMDKKFKLIGNDEIKLLENLRKLISY